MISDVRIYSADGKLKEVVSGKELSDKYWDDVLGSETPHSKITRLRVKKRMNKVFNRPPKPETLLLLDRILQVLRKQPAKNKGWTRAEISRKLKGVSIHRIRAVLDRAHLDLYGGHTVKQQVRPGSHPKAVEYYLEVK